MGRDKAALPWLDHSLLLPWLVRALTSAGWLPKVVVSPHTEPFWRARLPGDCLCLNPRPELGKITSIQTGLRAVPPEARNILFTAVDQPRPPALYRLLARLAGSSPVLVPDNAGHRGHPAVVSAALREELSTLEENRLGLRGFLDRHRADTTLVPCPAEWLRWDFNTPEAYREALAWFRRNQDNP